MSGSDQRSTILDDLTNDLHPRLPGLDASGLRPMLEHWLLHVRDEDLLGLDTAQFAELLRTHLELGMVRQAGQCLVRVLPSPVAGQPAMVHVVSDDRPFIVDTVAIALTRCGWTIRELFHPQFTLVRDDSGRLVGMQEPDEPAPAGTEPAARPVDESWVSVLVDPPLGAVVEDAAAELASWLDAALHDLELAVDDFGAMHARMVMVADELAQGRGIPASIGAEERNQAVDLLRYLADDHFTFLSYREFSLVDGQFMPVGESGLGTRRGSSEPERFNALPTREPVLLAVMTKDVERARMHRGALLDYVGIRIFDEAGQVTGEHRFLGLLGQGAYTESIGAIPVLRAKAEEIVARSGYEPRSHGALAIWSVLDTFPRDELFHASVAELEPMVASINQLKERRQVRLFLREGQWGGRLTALVYFPRDRYTTQVRQQMEQILVRATGATSIDFQVRVSESVLARLYFILELDPQASVHPDAAALEAELTSATRGWEDEFVDLAAGMATGERGIAFPPKYQEDYTPRQGLADLKLLNRSTPEDPVQLAIFAPDEADDPSDLRLKMLGVGGPVQLQEVMPHLTSLGVRVLDERPHELELRGEQAMVYDFGLRIPGGRDAWDEPARARLAEAFKASWQGRTEVDELNALVAEAGFTWREVQVLRAISRYLRQLGTPFSQSYIAQALRANLPVARHLVELFAARFDPRLEEGRAQLVDERHAALLAELDAVEVLDHDRILRQFVEILQASVRTNHYAADAPALAIKLLPREISSAPEPRPAYEIFVHSPRVEGLHLRFGEVARGGLRWSDRPEDFRTEVLGLVKAQMVKNTVIVPVGAKGGFFARQLPNPAVDRAAWLEEGKAAYRIFVSSLLSLTDNIVEGRVVPPRDVVRHDGDDPYLVVAADKGTATFSDIANAIAIERGFWLGDAFASGGSVGYDHKAMGITARGAWESVKHHFREMGVDCQAEDFTCVGIGDMAGDVFGNGMLLSRHTRLVAAFNHMHIFLDPNPDAATSFAERERLFHLPRSSWADYDASLISEGGGVHPRSAKSIPITPQVRASLGLADDVSAMTPTELIRAILAAPVDLLWNGGIGTYVKGSQETNLQVGDKANDAVRLDGAQVRARVAGEGGNLGWTQAGRIEYALAGGRINTDFIDNSAGVDTSDHEVNIKILLDTEVSAGRLAAEERNALLPRMTEDVAELVLSHNVDQNLALANARRQAAAFAGIHEDWMRQLEMAGYLDRTIEGMPSSAAMAARIKEGRGLTGPELATLLAWSKIWLSDEILASDLPDDPYVADRLVQYFPPLLRERYRDRMGAHRLHREIITTVAVNRFVNSQGMTACHRLADETGASPADVIRAQLAARSIFDAGRVEVNTRRAAMDAAMQTDMRLALRQLVEQGARWVLHRNVSGIDVQALIGRYHDEVQGLFARLPELLASRARARYDEDLARVLEGGVDGELARVAVGAPWAHLLPACVTIAQESGLDAALVARTFFLLSERLGLDVMLQRIEELPRTNRWDTMARSAIRDDLLAVQSQLAAQVLACAEDGDDPQQVLERWWGGAAGVEQRTATLGQVLDGDADLARMSVALRTVRSLVVAP